MESPISDYCVNNGIGDSRTSYNDGVRLSLSVSCVSPPLVPIFGQFLFLSSFVIISSQPCVFSWLVPSPVLLIILFAPSFPSLYKSSVFPVSLSSINVIPSVCTCLQRSLFYVTLKCLNEVHRLLVPGTPVHPWQNTGPTRWLQLRTRCGGCGRAVGGWRDMWRSFSRSPTGWAGMRPLWVRVSCWGWMMRLYAAIFQ